MYNYTIVINATAAQKGGALSILENILENIPNDCLKKYVVLVSIHLSIEIDNVQIIYVPPQNWIRRVFWDAYGFKQFLFKQHIYPNLILSLQNTGVNYFNCPQLIYYHQPIPLMRFQWSFMRKNERLLFFYKRVYPYFVKHWINQDTHIIVQLKCFVEPFCEKYAVKSTHVHTITPTISVPSRSDFQKFDDDFLHFIYPASAIKYKNHLILVEALNYLKRESIVLSKVKIHLTILKSDNSNLCLLIKKYELESNFIFEGQMPQSDLFTLYNKSNCLLFPSYIETFGLPLIEAASFGLPIIVSDEDYAKEVLREYRNVKYVKYNSAEEWANQVLSVCLNSKRQSPMITTQNSWDHLFSLINQLVQNNYK